MLLTLANPISAEIQAVTDNGDIVILNDDRTCQYKHERTIDYSDIVVNEKDFKKSEDAYFLLKSKKNNFGIWLNTNEWQFGPPYGGEDAEYFLKLKDEDLYGLVVSERIIIDPEKRMEIHIDQFLMGAADAKVIKKERRKVNGVDATYAEITGTFEGIRFSYFNIYTSNDTGTTQIMLWTGHNLTERYKSHIEKILSGLAEF